MIDGKEYFWFCVRYIGSGALVGLLFIGLAMLLVQLLPPVSDVTEQLIGGVFSLVGFCLGAVACVLYLTRGA